MVLMMKSGEAEKYVRVVKDMYEEVELHQGSALRSFLFAVVVDRLTDEVRHGL